MSRGLQTPDVPSPVHVARRALLAPVAGVLRPASRVGDTQLPAQRQRVGQGHAPEGRQRDTPAAGPPQGDGTQYGLVQKSGADCVDQDRTSVLFRSGALAARQCELLPGHVHA
ncbi:unnamed protein product [Prorocentrum cordatum]|uniref:Uncharacterized protein n=1 Tax=Prorocentrum cordatum TaxID=2364126 RepID=A0ABN9VKL1_9DINO|nr:unnamed protein product [Polarella glacialis]